jgi:hypothetical protein
MIPVSVPISNIYLHGLQVDKHVVEIDEIAVSSTAVIYAGNAVVLDTTTNGGVVKIATTTSNKIMGLAKSSKNSYVDETKGDIGGIYGSNCMSVVCKGIVTVRHSYYLAVNGSIVTVKGYDDTNITVATDPMTALYITSAGVITNTTGKAGSGAFSIGFLLQAPTAAQPAIQVYLDC